MATLTRSEQAKINGKRGKGPVSLEGKRRSKQNALKHGFTAAQLTLPTETPELIQEHAEQLFDSLEPVTNHEIEMANQGALASIRYARLARAEAEIVAEQIRHAEVNWILEQQTKLDDLKDLIKKNPGRAVIQLKAFAEGVRWLIQEWSTLEMSFETMNSFLHFDGIRAALRLQGYNPERLCDEPLRAIEFTTRALVCQPGSVKSDESRRKVSNELSIGCKYAGLLDEMAEYDKAESAEVIKKWMADELDRLRTRCVALEAIEKASRAGARSRALSLEPTPKNRLLVRYSGELHREYCRVVKTLTKAREEREEIVEDRLESAPPVVQEPSRRNEPESAPEMDASQNEEESYVSLSDRFQVAVERNDQTLKRGLFADLAKALMNPEEGADSREVSAARMAG